MRLCVLMIVNLSITSSGLSIMLSTFLLEVRVLLISLFSIKDCRSSYSHILDRNAKSYSMYKIERGVGGSPAPPTFSSI